MFLRLSKWSRMGYGVLYPVLVLHLDRKALADASRSCWKLSRSREASHTRTRC